jgi:hypothetical protein
MIELTDGMRVRTTKDRELWVADWYLLDHYNKHGLSINWDKIPDNLSPFRVDCYKAMQLGYKWHPRRGGLPVIPAGSLGYMRKQAHYVVFEKVEPFLILGQWCTIRQKEELMVPYSDSFADSSERYAYWWALELDMFPIDGNKRGYCRGVYYLGSNEEAHNPGRMPWTHPDINCLPDYLEEIKDNG